MEYFYHLAILVLINILLAQSLNLTFGLGRMLNLSHIASFAIGAYVTALTYTTSEISYLGILGLSMIASGILALCLGWVSLRLSGDYFAIATIAFTSFISALLINWRSVTKGVLGVTGIPRPIIWGLELNDNSQFLLFLSFLVLGALVFLYRLFNTEFSRRVRSIANDSVSSAALGINATSTNLIAFIISAFCAGGAGSIYAVYINYIDPSVSALSESIMILCMVVIGQPGSFWGCIVATIFLTLLPEPIRFLDVPSSILGPARQLIYAAILWGVLYRYRYTIFPTERKV